MREAARSASATRFRRDITHHERNESRIRERAEQATMTIRIGIVGAGANTRDRHIPGFQAIDGVELAAVANRSRASGERVAEQFGIRRVYDHWQEVIEDDDIDAVMIGTWPYLHAPITLAALEAGKHVLTEARMAMDAAEAHRMLEASRKRRDLVCQI